MTIGNLMRLLSDGEVHSGEQLGEALGVSRAAVWKQLKKLEALGVELVHRADVRELVQDLTDASESRFF